jgi:hypothetical protein
LASLVKSVIRSRPLRAARAAVTHRLRQWDTALQGDASWAIAVAALAVLQLALIFTHDPWLDEYQAVQIAVQAPDVPTLLSWLRYEGHPPLWYFVLRGLAHLVDPLWTLPIAAALCAAVTQGCILFASPFKRVERLLIAASQFVLFEHLTISRSLSLGAAALFGAMALWRSRVLWIAIAVLPMCDFLFGVMSLALVALKLRERDLWWPGVALWIASGLLSAWSVIPASDAIPAIVAGNPLAELAFWAMTMGNLLVPFQGIVLPQWNDFPLFLVASWGWAAFIYFAWVQTSGDRWHRVILMALIGLTLVFSMTVYRLSARHLMIIALALILLTWRARAAGHRARAGFQLWIAIAAACGLFTGLVNLAWPFDRAPEVARKIEQLGLRDEHWVVFPISRAQGVSALTGIAFEQTEKKCMQSFIKWNSRTRLTRKRWFIDYFRREAQEHGRGYLLSDVRLKNMPADVLKPLAFFPRGYDGQAFYIYVIGADMPRRAVSLPPCVEGKRPFTRLQTPVSLGKK